jgi:hypothetical protein
MFAVRATHTTLLAMVVEKTAAALVASKGVVAASSKGAPGATSKYMLMGTVGVGAAIAAAMARLGLKSNDDSSSTSGSSTGSGMVSKRMSLMKDAEELPRVDDSASVTPSFIEVRSSTRGLGSETFVEDLNGMEVQGPYRPSSNYAV